MDEIAPAAPGPGVPPPAMLTPPAPHRGRRGWLAWLVYVTCFGGAIYFAIHGARALSGEGSDDEVKAQVYASIGKLDETGFARMGKPEPGDWLDRFQETPQSMGRYRLSTPVRPTKDRRTVVLQPLGPMNEEQTKVVEAMRDYAEIFFQLPARVADSLPLEIGGKSEALTRKIPLGNRHGTYDTQYDAEKILDEILAKKLPDDAVVYLGVTMQDLWADNLNFVFGLGSFGRRVGVYSLARYYPEFWGKVRKDGDEIMGLRRSCKVLNHEAGHMFGLSHCVFYHCSMNGSNSLAETDRAPIHFCPLCHRKLQWNIGFDANKRYEALRDFYAKHEMAEEAEWMKGRIERWKEIATKDAIENGTAIVPEE